MSHFEFNKLKQKKPLWQEVLVFMITIGSVWGATHLGMNSDAYAQISQYKYDTLKASVISDYKVIKAEKTQTQRKRKEIKIKTLNKVQKGRIDFRKKEIKAPNSAHIVFERMEVFPSDNRLVIPRIGKNVPLIEVPNNKNWKELETGIQDGLQNGVVVHPISRDPGSFGNFFLTGHSSYYVWDEGRYKDVFALLHEVKVGDMVEVYWGGKQYKYKMREKKVVPPTAVEVLNQPKDRSVITLMTCTPIGTNTNRLILVGDLKE